MNVDDPRHGTYAGYQRHRKDGEAACGPCRTANAEYNRTHRSKPVARMKSRKVSKAGGRAAWRLVNAHRDEYDRYYAEELAALARTPEPRSA